MHASSAVGAPYEANLHPNSQYMRPAAAKQASAVHWTVCKPMTCHKTALHTHHNHHSGTRARWAQNWLCMARAAIKTSTRGTMGHAVADKRVYVHEALHLKGKLQAADYKQAVEKWGLGLGL